MAEDVSPAVSNCDREAEAERNFHRGLLQHRPNLKAFACSLARDVEMADDLVQETMVRALKYRHQFDVNTNLRAWLFTILKNLFRTGKRRQAKEAEMTGTVSNSLLFAVSGGQEDALFLSEVADHMRALPPQQARAILLVGALGHSVQDVARREGCPSGTIKSRVSRGRSALLEGTS